MDEMLTGDLNQVLRRIIGEVEPTARRWCLWTRSLGGGSERCRQQCAQRAAAVRAGAWRAEIKWQPTTFPIRDDFAAVDNDPVFTVSHKLIWVRHIVERNSMLRKIETMTMRGWATLPGLHPFRIGNDGLTIFSPAPS